MRGEQRVLNGGLSGRWRGREALLYLPWAWESDMGTQLAAGHSTVPHGLTGKNSDLPVCPSHQVVAKMNKVMDTEC